MGFFGQDRQLLRSGGGGGGAPNGGLPPWDGVSRAPLLEALGTENVCYVSVGRGRIPMYDLSDLNWKAGWGRTRIRSLWRGRVVR